ncbi:MAG: hypothetical protein M5U15_11950 [Kiritimatiellae bacterium]|nr:hypothetical protein [Kiritimatiellia bacterium]
MKNRWLLKCVPLLIVVFCATACAEHADLRLALELNNEGDHAGTAIEFRRLALSEPDAASRAVYFWSAAFETWKAGEAARADALLDRAEDEQALSPADVSVLRGELSLARRQPNEAAFHFENAARAAASDAREFALRKQVVADLRAGKNNSALQAASAAGSEAEAALAAYFKGHDKSPALGGWLGSVPGLGYAYAGEYANALRSIILNGLFIWGMVETASDDQWGAFAALTFFEVTWYTGSIYGGIDASHRYNQRRLAKTEIALTSGFALQPDYQALPTLQLRYRW